MTTTLSQDRCQVITNSGTQCRRLVHKDGTTMCRYHEWAAEQAARKADD